MNRQRLHAIFVNILSLEDASSIVDEWIKVPHTNRSGHSICFANVHMCMEAIDCEKIKKPNSPPKMVDF